jgi:protein TonB
MRTSTFVVSFVVHATFIAVAVVVPILATDVLPRPAHSLAFVASLPPALPEPPPVATPRREPAPSAVRADAAPVSEPVAIALEPTRVPFDLPVSSEPGLAGSSTDIGGVESIVVPPPLAASAPSAPREPARVGGAIRAPHKTHHVAPRYPAIALASRVSGIVILEAVIAEDGAVRDLRVLRSMPLLDGAAMEAVRQWRFAPSLLNGEPVPVVMTVTVTFNLN